jgi:hypothetical protein
MLSSCVSSQSPTNEVTVDAPIVHVTVSKSADGFAEIAQHIVSNELEGVKVLFNPKPMADTDLRLDLQMAYRNVTETEFEMIWRMTNIMYLLTFYPSTCRHRVYTLTATLNDAHGRSRTYEETDTTVAWLWLFNGSKCGETPVPEEIEEVAESLLDKVLEQMRKDDAFAGFGLTAQDKEAPLVNIILNRATDIAAQVLNVDRYFAHWTIGDNDTKVPDYRIDLHFDVQPGSVSMLKGYLTIMTMGLTSPCRTSKITLMATVTGPDAVMTRSYNFTDSLFGRMGDHNDCEIPDESKRPEVFAKLLRKAFEKIAQDKLIEVGSHPPGGPLPPLICIRTSRAENIVRRETLSAASFERYYFYDSTEYIPDYNLMLDFQFKRGGRKQFSTTGEIAAGMAVAFGVILFCNPTDMILDAVLSDRSGSEIRQYHIERTFGFSDEFAAGPSCRDDELTNPAAVSELVRLLYTEMASDGTLANLSAQVNLTE